MSRMRSKSTTAGRDLLRSGLSPAAKGAAAKKRRRSRLGKRRKSKKKVPLKEQAVKIRSNALRFLVKEMLEELEKKKETAPEYETDSDTEIPKMELPPAQRRLKPLLKKLDKVFQAYSIPTRFVSGMQFDEDKYVSLSEEDLVRKNALDILQADHKGRLISEADAEVISRAFLSFPFFSDIAQTDPASFRAVCQRLQYARAPAGQTVFRKGEHADAVYVILSGSVVVRNSVPDIILKRLLKNQRRAARRASNNKPDTIVEEDYEPSQSVMSEEVLNVPASSAIPLSSSKEVELTPLSKPGIEQEQEQESSLLNHSHARNASSLMSFQPLNLTDSVDEKVIDICILRSQDVLGECSVLECLPRHSTIVCEEDCEFLVIDKWTYHRFVRNISTSNLRIVREEYQGGSMPYAPPNVLSYEEEDDDRAMNAAIDRVEIWLQDNLDKLADIVRHKRKSQANLLSPKQKQGNVSDLDPRAAPKADKDYLLLQEYDQMRMMALYLRQNINSRARMGVGGAWQFKAMEAVTFLVKEGVCSSIREAVLVGRAMQRYDLIDHVDYAAPFDNNDESFRFADDDLGSVEQPEGAFVPYVPSSVVQAVCTLTEKKESKIDNDTIDARNQRTLQRLADFLASNFDVDARSDACCKPVPKCFSGAELVEWLLRNKVVESDGEGVLMGRMLQRYGHLDHLDLDLKFRASKDLFRLTVHREELDGVSVDKFKLLQRLRNHLPDAVREVAKDASAAPALPAPDNEDDEEEEEEEEEEEDKKSKDESSPDAKAADADDKAADDAKGADKPADDAAKKKPKSPKGSSKKKKRPKKRKSSVVQPVPGGRDTRPRGIHFLLDIENDSLSEEHRLFVGLQSAVRLLLDKRLVPGPQSVGWCKNIENCLPATAIMQELVVVGLASDLGQAEQFCRQMVAMRLMYPLNLPLNSAFTARADTFYRFTPLAVEEPEILSPEDREELMTRVRKTVNTRQLEAEEKKSMDVDVSIDQDQDEMQLFNIGDDEPKATRLPTMPRKSSLSRRHSAGSENAIERAALQSVLRDMHDEYTGIQFLNRRARDGRTVLNSFLAKDAVEWLVAQDFAANPGEAIVIGRLMQRHGLIAQHEGLYEFNDMPLIFVLKAATTLSVRPFPSHLDYVSRRLWRQNESNNRFQHESDEAFVRSTSGRRRKIHDQTRGIDLSYLAPVYVEATMTEEQRLHKATMLVHDAVDAKRVRPHRTTKRYRRAEALFRGRVFHWWMFGLIMLHMLIAEVEPPSYLDAQGEDYPRRERGVLIAIEWFIVLWYLSETVWDFYDLGGFWFFRSRMKVVRAVIIALIITDLIFASIFYVEDSTDWFRFSRPLRPFMLLFRFRYVRRISYITVSLIPRIFEILLLMTGTVVFFAVMGSLWFQKINPAYEIQAWVNGTAPYSQCTPCVAMFNGTVIEVPCAGVACDPTGVVPDSAFAAFRGVYDNTLRTLFVLMTRSNFPQVAFPAYLASHANMGYFITFIVVVAFFFLSLLTAYVVHLYSEISSGLLEGDAAKEQAALNAAFQVMNINDSGVMTYDTFSVLLCRIKGSSRYPEFKIRTVFSLMNGNGDGVLSQQEFGTLADFLHLQISTAYGARLRTQTSNPTLETSVTTSGNVVPSSAGGASDEKTMSIADVDNKLPKPKDPTKRQLVRAESQRVTISKPFTIVRAMFDNTVFATFKLIVVVVDCVLLLLLATDPANKGLSAIDALCVGLFSFEIFLNLLVQNWGFFQVESFAVLVDFCHLLGVVRHYTTWLDWSVPDLLLLFRFAGLLKGTFALAALMGAIPFFSTRGKRLTGFSRVIVRMIPVFVGMVFMLGCIVFYPFAIVGIELFNGPEATRGLDRCDDKAFVAEGGTAHFCDLNSAFLSLFFILSDSAFEEYMFNVLNESSPDYVLYFVAFYFLGNIVLLNLLLAVFYDLMTTERESNLQAHTLSDVLKATKAALGGGDDDQSSQDDSSATGGNSGAKASFVGFNQADNLAQHIILKQQAGLDSMQRRLRRKLLTSSAAAKLVEASQGGRRDSVASIPFVRSPTNSTLSTGGSISSPLHTHPTFASTGGSSEGGRADQFHRYRKSTGSTGGHSRTSSVLS